VSHPRELVGRRVRLTRTEHTRLTPGTEGTIARVVDEGTVQVRWDDGHERALEAGDRWELIPDDGDGRCSGYGPDPDLEDGP
jgi:hypothetical protein